ncbi:hypothetical protein F5Y18DRAFT_438886 [Xylariaceae sp. FL1019]|nr:hypothetical protein F5Y18DRAFT_438886 [Xylariaceae sp. FL1019]
MSALAAGKARSLGPPVAVYLAPPTACTITEPNSLFISTSLLPLQPIAVRLHHPLRLLDVRCQTRADDDEDVVEKEHRNTATAGQAAQYEVVREWKSLRTIGHLAHSFDTRQAAQQRVRARNIQHLVSSFNTPPRTTRCAVHAMADQADGSSLPQIQRHGRQQSHVHYHNTHNAHHASSRQHRSHHARSHNHDPEHIHAERDEAAESTIVIVQTISVYQITDASGATIVQTLPSPDTTSSPGLIQTTDIVPVATTTATTASSSSLLDDSTTSATSSDGDVDTSPAASYPTVEDPTVTPSGSSMPTSFPTLSYASFTSAPLTATPVFPSVTGASNSTASASGPGFSNSTASLLSFTSSSETASSETDGAFSIFGSAGTSSTSTSSSSSSSSPSSSLSSSASSTSPPSSSSTTSTTSSTTSSSSASSTSSSSSYSTVTYSHVGTGTSTTSYSSPTLFTSSYDPDVTPLTAGGNGLTTTASSPTPTVGANGSNSSDTTVSKATIAGSVVGAISGLVFLLLLATAFLRWKKRHPGIKLLGNERGPQGMLTGAPSGPSGGGDASGGDMAQRRRSVPFAIPAALANLSGPSRFSRSTVSSDGGERGFAKISGRKLPPVLQFGGDGYTDPRATMMSDQSVDYRDSQMFFGDATPSRLAVGSPMLQESGTPIFHASPARTAVREEGPFSNPFSDDNAISHDPPRSSGRGAFGRQRFTEDL